MVFLTSLTGRDTNALIVSICFPPLFHHSKSSLWPVCEFYRNFTRLFLVLYMYDTLILMGFLQQILWWSMMTTDQVSSIPIKENLQKEASQKPLYIARYVGSQQTNTSGLSLLTLKNWELYAMFNKTTHLLSTALSQLMALCMHAW